MKRLILTAITGVVLAQAGAGEPSNGAVAEPAASAGINGGLIVCLGVASPDRLADLVRHDRFLIHGLDPDGAVVEKARLALEKTGLYGRRVSVEQGRLNPLPYASSLANMVVVNGPVKGLDIKEVFRITAAGGKIWVATGVLDEGAVKAGGFTDVRSAAGGWLATKVRPAGLDEWPHWRRDAADNAVSRDAFTGPPAQMQWIAEPHATRGHKPGIVGISAGGRVFYTHDELAPFFESSKHPGKSMALLARDAFSGVLLWKHPIASMYVRGLAADGVRVFTVLESRGPCVALNAATGEVVYTCKGTEGAGEIRHLDGVVLIKTQGALHAAEAAGGRVLWSRPLSDKGDAFLAAEGRVILHSQKDGALVALDLKSGAEVWKRSDAAWLKGAGLSTCGENAVFFTASTGQAKFEAMVYAVSWKDGADLWNRKLINGNHYFPSQTLALRAGLLFVRARAETGGYLILDPRTGQDKGESVPFSGGGGGGKCTIETLSLTHLLKGGMTSLSAIDKAGIAKPMDCISVRSACKTGTVPANGLQYYFTQDCSCGNTLRGTFALVPAPAAHPALPPGERLQRGSGNAGALKPAQDEWPTFRQNPLRGGASAASVPGALSALWTVKMSGIPTAPVAAGGLVFAGSSDHHVRAFDSATGALKWSYATGAPLRLPPTIHDGLCLAGSNDGWIHALNAETGKLVWRLHVAPQERKMVAFEQVESAWPLHAGVLVQDGVGYAMAGRMRDGDGAWVLAFEPQTGKILWEKKIADLTAADVLFSDGKFVYAGGTRSKSSNWPCAIRMDLKTGEMTGLKGKGATGMWVSGPHLESHPNLGCKWAFDRFVGERLVIASGRVFAAEWKRIEYALNGSSRVWLDGGWSLDVPGLRVDELVLAGETLLAAGRGETGSEVWTVSATDGKKLGAVKLSAPPVLCGLAAAGGRAFVTTEDGSLSALGGK
ncbi:MAG: hypothetical protein C0404_13165 [Verrucomicrobia bacterium]|nr:hypothetical protein [Verrucomicrobiota bacterium]